MIGYRILQVLLLVSSMAFQAIGMLPTKELVRSMPFQVEGIAQRIEELPKEVRYKIFSSALALRENPKYEVYKRFDAGSSVITGMALNADNTRVLIAPGGRIACIVDTENGTILKELKGHKESITSAVLSIDGSIAFTGSWDGTVRVWNIFTGEAIRIIEVGSYNVASVVLSVDGTLALIGCIDDIARLYNTSTGELLKELKGHTRDIVSVALSADGTLALTGSWDGTARVWNTVTGELLKTLQVGSVRSVALSADGTIALIRADKNKVLVWDTKSGALLNRLLPNTEFIYSIALSKDGKRALVSTQDNKIQVWNTQPLSGQKETSTPLTVLEGHNGPVTVLVFGDDFIVSGSHDTTIIIWKPFALEPQDPQENIEVLRQAYKETFSRPKFLFPAEK